MGASEGQASSNRRAAEKEGNHSFLLFFVPFFLRFDPLFYPPGQHRHRHHRCHHHRLHRRRPPTDWPPSPTGRLPTDRTTNDRSVGAAPTLPLSPTRDKDHETSSAPILCSTTVPVQYRYFSSELYPLWGYKLLEIGVRHVLAAVNGSP